MCEKIASERSDMQMRVAMGSDIQDLIEEVSEKSLNRLRFDQLIVRFNFAKSR